MSDLDLHKKLQIINRRGNGSKLSMLEELKIRVSTDLLLIQLRTDDSRYTNDRIVTKEKMAEDDLENVESCIKIYEDGHTLNGDAMIKINEINKRYRRIK